SACFLVASLLAWFEVCHAWAAWRPRLWSWWITLLNLLGSVAFGVSAVASYVSPVTGDIRNAERANLGTFVGAVCFLIGAVLLLPERTETASGQVPAQSPCRWRVRHGCTGTQGGVPGLARFGGGLSVRRRGIGVQGRGQDVRALRPGRRSAATEP